MQVNDENRISELAYTVKGTGVKVCIWYREHRYIFSDNTTKDYILQMKIGGAAGEISLPLKQNVISHASVHGALGPILDRLISLVDRAVHRRFERTYFPVSKICMRDSSIA